MTDDEIIVPLGGEVVSDLIHVCALWVALNRTMPGDNEYFDRLARSATQYATSTAEHAELRNADGDLFNFEDLVAIYKRYLEEAGRE